MKIPLFHTTFKWLQRPRNKWLHRLYKTCGIGAGILLLFLIIDLIFPVRTKLEYAPLVRSRDSAVLYAFLTKDEQWRMFTTLEEITPELSKAIIFKEDKYFYSHPGINPAAIGRAVIQNLIHGRRTSGASTITMQVARMLYPKKRNYVNKLIEMFRALQLEFHFSKREILQLYLNMVPYGSNIQGVKAAALLYFHKLPDQLSLAEITALSIIPNRPNALVMGKNNDRIIALRNIWLNRFEDAGLFLKQTLTDARQEPLTAHRTAAPRQAPQFALRIRRSFPNSQDIITTIDAGIQQKVTELTAQYSQALQLHQIHNAAVIVVDNRNREVLAYLGSADFLDQQHAGQVDGVRALRSPGSTLKPFLYGLAFDKGIATPRSMVSDIPTDFNGYRPENYDLNFRGNISIGDALRQSLNIPAVKILNRLGVMEFVRNMHHAGFDAVWNARQKMGLSMILGGCGVSLESLAALYAAFANQGLYQPLHWLKSPQETVAQADSSVRILSPESAYMIAEILRELQRPDLPNANVSALNIPQIAWKTGTSYGRRDAWSIGYNQRYTIAVWLGNFSGQGAAELSGANTATPLLFQLFNAIDRNATSNSIDAPPGLRSRYVCSMSGRIPSELCTELVMDTYIPGVSDNRPCDHLKTVYLSADEQFSFCTSCMPATGYKAQLFANIEPELAAFYDQRNIGYDKIPEHNPACSRYFGGAAPQINSLTNGSTYLITDKGKQQLQLGCAASGDVTKVYWYINDRFIGSCGSKEKIMFLPEAGRIKISCSDDKGRSVSIYVNVKFI